MSELLRTLREAKGLTLATLAEMVGTTRQQIHKLEMPNRSISVDWAERLARALGVSPAEILGVAPGQSSGHLSHLPPASTLKPNARILPDAINPFEMMRGAEEDGIPVYGVASAGPDGRFVINQNDGPIAYVPRPPGIAHHKRVFAVLVDGTSMIPWRQPGEIVFAVPGLPLLKDCHVLVQLETGPGEAPESFVKQFLRRDNGELVLRQYNPQQDIHLERDRVREMWRVLEWREVFGL